MNTPIIEIFPWNENFATGIAGIDEEHRTLIGLLNQLVSHLAFQSDVPTLNGIFAQLADYAAHHFASEEAVWHAYLADDPWETWHKHAHVSFVDEVLRLKAEENNKPLDDVIEDIVSFLTRWLAFHILESDRRLAKVVLALPSGMSLEQAKEVANNEMSGATKVLIETVMKMYDNLANRTVQLTREMNRRRSAEQELQIANLVYQNSSEAMAVIDAENRIIAVNPAFTQMTGYGLEEIKRLGLESLGAGEGGSAVLQALRGAPDALGNWRGDIWLRHKNGADYAARLTLNAILDDSGKVTRRVALFMDITERKRRDEELELAKQQAVAASRAKSEFLANMSHEIRTPLNAIIGLTHMLQRSESPASSHEKLKTIEQSALHLLQILNEVLDISRIEAGRLVLEQTEFDLEELLEHILHWLGEQAIAKGLEIVADMEPGLSSGFRGDALRLKQILLNLTGNAVKFTKAGHVLVRARCLEDTGGDCLIRFEVRDTGIGIDADNQHRLFNTFEQLDGSITRDYGGTGLGLAIAKQLVTMMGGEIGVESQLGQGSSFWFTLRLPRTAGKALEPVAADASFAGARALVVDDLSASREALAGLFGHLGFRTDMAASGDEALAAIQAADAAGDAYQWIIIDQSMPGMDGCETAAQLQRLPLKHPPRRRLLAIHGNPKSVAPTPLTGIDALLAKPALVNGLRKNLLAVLSNTTLPLPLELSRGLAEQELARRCGGARLLLAEDEPISQQVAVDLLESVGLRVDVANDGAEAVERARNTDYALILLDLHMPNMDGLEASRAIRALPGRQTLPILAMTADAFLEDRATCLKAGMNDHLSKPVVPETLYETLLKWLERPTGAGADAMSPPDPEACGSGQEASGALINEQVKKHQRPLRLRGEGWGEGISGEPLSAHPTIPPDNTRKPSILCIDNEPRRLSELGGILGEHYRLHFARDANMALSAMRKLKPSLILLDTRVPDVGGLELCRRLKEDPATRALPIVFVMDAVEADDERTYIDAGGVDVLVRPLMPPALLATIRGLLSNTPAMP